MSDNPYQAPQSELVTADSAPKPPRVRTDVDVVFRPFFWIATLAGAGVFVASVIYALFSERTIYWSSVALFAFGVFAVIFVAGMVITAPIVLVKRFLKELRKQD